MLFNSLTFLLFFVAVFIIYWLVFNKNTKHQNIFLLVASYFFYGYWDWRFLSLIAISSASDYIIGLAIDKQNNNKKRKQLLTISIIINLTILGFFKYFNFFTDNLLVLLNTIGFGTNQRVLNIILPVGISFYTFQTMSYTIDIYRKQLRPTKSVINFFTYVAFFPQLVAGPIERAKNLLPQFAQSRKFIYTNATDGLKQILWGLFQKIVIADNCAPLVDMAFNNPAEYSSPFLIMGAILFAFQVYGDFAGYSNMAIGIARLLGFNLMQNFAAPYFSQSITEIWRRWHISLSTWLRDYLFTPLALQARNMGVWGVIAATLITFTISGLWHGANWNFIFWGFLHGLALSYEVLTKKTRKHLKSNILPIIYNPVSTILTFAFWVFALVFFRSAGTFNGFLYIKSVFSNSFTFVNYPFESKTITITLLITFFMLIDFAGRNRQYAIKTIAQSKPLWVRYLFYSFIVFLILAFYPTQGSPFIYFQF